MNGNHAWLTLIGAVTAWEVHCIRTGRHDELLSRTLDRARATHPVANVVILAAIAATSTHLARIVPERMDVFALLHLA